MCSEDRISGFSDRLTENDDLIATAQGQVAQAEGQTSLPHITALGMTNSPHSQLNDFSPAGDPPSPSILSEH